MSNILAIRETTGGKRFVYNNCDILGKYINILFYYSEVGTGSSSHDFDGDSHILPFSQESRPSDFFAAVNHGNGHK